MDVISILSVFVLRAGLEHESRSEAREHAAFYLRGKEVFIISTYNYEEGRSGGRAQE